MEKFIACVKSTLLTGFASLSGKQDVRSACRAPCRRLWAVLAMIIGLAPAAHALQFTVTWDINSVGELGFNIERSNDGTNFSQIATVAAGVSSYIDTNLPSGSYWYRVRAFTSSTYSAYSNVASTQTAVSMPSFTTQPVSQSSATGGSASFTVVATGSPTPSIQWKKNGVAITGATASTLTLTALSSSDAATYTAVAANSAGSVTSIGAVLTLTTAVAPTPIEPAPTSQIENLSARAVPGKGGQSMSLDFTLKGNGSKVLVRAIGPGLAAFTSAATFVDPKLGVTSDGTNVGSNDNWGGTTELASVFTQVGAFPLAVNSKDAALVLTLPAKAYSATISGKNGGIAMLEVYNAAVATGRVSEVKVAAPVGTGDQRLIGGFTITGTESLRVLIRAVGPGLGGRNVLSDPQLDLHRGTTLVARNDNWGGTAALSTSFGLAGAASLPPASKDSAIDVTLAPGTYTATVSGVNNTSGYAQLEVYEVR